MSYFGGLIKPRNMNKRGTLTFLGTGTSQGIPIIGCDCPTCASSDPKDKRLRSSVHIVFHGVHLQIDTGPDFRTQMLQNNLRHVDAVLITHEHQDHIAGLDDTRPLIFRTKKDMPIYGQERVLQRIRKVYDYAFQDHHYPGAPKFELHTVATEPFEIQGVTVVPLPVWHGKLPILGYRVGRMAYITDTNGLPESTLELLNDLDILVLDALQNEPHFSHYTLEESRAVAEQIGAKQTYFIHMSHKLPPHSEVQPILGAGQFLGYDGLTVTFGE